MGFILQNYSQAVAKVRNNDFQDFATEDRIYGVKRQFAP